MTLRKAGVRDRLIALILTWAMPGASAWALTPSRGLEPSAAAVSVSGESAAAAPEPKETSSPDPLSPSGAAVLDDDDGHGDHDEDDDHHEHRDDERGVRPILECVVRNSPGSYTAYFGFKNETDQAVSIPVGPSNAFTPAPQERGQPTLFPAGRSPRYPNAAFSVPFDGSKLTWRLRGPDHHSRTVTANSSSPKCENPPAPSPTPTATPSPLPSPTPPGACAHPVLGLRRFTRTSEGGGPTAYNQTFALPAGAVGPFTLRLVNGDAQGRNKTSAAEVKINGIDVAGDRDFSQSVVTFNKTIAALLPTNQLYVRVKSAPGSTFTIEICGSDPGDTAPPAVEWLAPPEGAILNDPSPLFRVRYSDLVSAPELATLKILVDGADRTSLFVKSADEACLDGLVSLADGAHNLHAEIEDQAGNLGVANRTFRIDAAAPLLAVNAPAASAVLNLTRPQLRVSFGDQGVLPSGVDATSLTVALDGVDITSALAVSGAEAAGLPPTALVNGPHLLEATIADLAGNETSTSSVFTIDTIPPLLSTVAPAAGAALGVSAVPIVVQYSDNHELNLDSFTAAIDGSPIPLLVDADAASGTSPSLSDGPHTLTLTIADRAGNVASSTTPFSTDTGLPVVSVTPPNGVILNEPSPEIVVAFADAQGIAPGTLRIMVNGVDRTAEFVQTAGEARATLPLLEGVNTINAQVRDNAANLGSATSTFTLDLTPPVVTVDAPAADAFLNDPTPDIHVTLADALSGVEPGTVRVFVDEADVTADFAIGPDGASGTLSTPLAEGPHVLRVVAADRAANPTVVEATFHLDLTPPTLEMASPRVDGFTNDSTPEIWLRTADPEGALGSLASGIDAASIRLFLLSEDPLVADTDITSLLSVDAAGGRGEFVTALLDGSHRLRAVARDRAGNESAITVGFVVDTLVPQVVIDQPQSHTFLNTAEPVVVLLYSDDRSGIDPELTQVKIDGIEYTSSLTLTPTGATLTLARSLGLDLADGSHVIEARVVDRAGNSAGAVPATFGVDTAAPTAAVVSPAAQSFVGSPTPALHLTLADAAPSSGIDPSFAQVLLDGVDITASLTFAVSGGATPADAVAVDVSGTAPQALSDGLHILRLTAIDNANNPVELISQFTVDTQPPVVTPEIPEEGKTVGGGGVQPDGTALITGTLNDADPGLSVSCSAGGATVAGVVQSGSYSCRVAVSEGVNQVTVTVSDSTGHTTTSTRDLTVDRTAPVVTIDSPSSNDATAAEFISVAGHVDDATAVSVTVNGIAATVTPAASGVPARFVASNIPVGPGPTLTVTATATDAGANTGQATVTVAVDRTPPVVVITKPAAGAYLKGGLTPVEVEVTDRSSTLLEVNGVMGFDPVCTGQDGASLTCHFALTIPLVGDGTITATAVDAAGNVGHAQTNAIIDSTPPNIVVISPAALLVTNAATLEVSGVVTDASPLTLTVNGQTVPTGEDGAFNASIAAGGEGQRDIVFVAIDAAGNQSTSTVPIIIDRTPPVLTIASPLQGAVIAASTVAVSGTVSDATSVTVTVQGSAASVIGQAYTATLSGVSDGAFAITVRAVDAAGNESVATRGVEIDLSPPTVAITSPEPGALTRESTALLAYTVLDRSRTTIRVNDVAASPDCPGVLPCDRSQTVDLAPGDNTFTVEATDAGGRTTTAQVTITRDSTPPVLDLQAAETVSRTRAGTATASATDNLAVAQIEIRQGSTLICSGASSCSGPIPVPEAARAGDSLTVTAIATDTAGNVTTTSRTVRVTADGVVTGTVLDDRTSLPLVGATVTLLGATSRTTTTDANGRYNLPVSDTSALLRIEKAGMSSVDRMVTVVSGVGTVPIDARLSELAAVIRVTGTPGQGVVRGPLNVKLPDGDHQVTLLSPQGLPNLLPLGFSPLVAFNWTSDAPPSGSAQAGIALPVGPAAPPEAFLVRYDTAMRDWRIVASGLLATNGVLIVDLAGTGTYALVIPDDAAPPIAIGQVGDALTGLDLASIPAAAASESRVDPAILPPTGGTATGSLRLDSPSTLPSGTVVQADITETYTLASGEEASAAKRSIDLVSYKHIALATSWGDGADAGSITGADVATVCAPTTPPTPDPDTPLDHLCAAFPITPSRSYATSELREGRVHLDLLAGRENARGVVGGNEALTVASGQVRLNVAAGGLVEDTAVALQAYDTFSSYVPAANGITPLGEVTVDFSAAILTTSASLTFLNVGAAPGDTLVVARVDRAAFDGIPRLQVVALAELQGTDAVSVAESGQPGITLEGIKKEGRYVLLRLAGPIGFIGGSTYVVTPAQAGAQTQSPVRALVTTNTLPFVATSTSNGYYAIPSVPGPVTVTARVLGQSLVGAANTTATTGAPTTADLALQGTVTQASITPASGAIGVEVNEPLTLTSPVALNPATVTAANITLRSVPANSGDPSIPVTLRFVLSGSGKQLSIIPTAPVTTPPTPAMSFSTNYILEIAGLLDTVGGVVTAPTTTFRTKDDIKPVYDLTAITFSLPSADNIVTVSAPAGTLAPGTTVLIINGGNGVVVSLTAGNDGDLQGDLPASIDDLLFVTVTDPFGNTSTFQRSEFVDPVTGETAVGAFGGRVRGPSGSALEVPEGALNKGTKFKLDFVTPESLEQLFPGQQPSFGLDASGQPISHIGGSLKVEVTAGDLASSKEIDLVFPLPSNLPSGVDPKDAYYYVYQRIEGPCPNGASTCAPGERPYFLRTLDHAFVECADGSATCDSANLRVRTASPPFNGFFGGLALSPLNVLFPTAAAYTILAWTYSQLAPGLPQSGVITGYVYQPEHVRDPNGIDKPVFKPVAGAQVSGLDAGGQAFTSGSQVAAVTGADGQYTLFDPRYSGGPFTIKARFVDPTTQETRETEATGFESDPQDSAALALLPPALRPYPNRAVLNLSLPITEAPPPPPEIGINVCEVTLAGCPARNDLALVGRPLRITAEVSVESGATIQDGEVGGAAVTVAEVASGNPAKRVYELRVANPAGDGTFTPSTPGAYVVRVQAITSQGDLRVETLTFRVVGATGAVEGLPNEAPAVITRKTLPQNGAAGVSVTNLYPEVYFTEPVRGLIPGTTIRLEQVDGDDPGPVEFSLIGIGVDGTGAPTIVKNVTAATLMSSVTLKPTRGLKLGARYVLTLDGAIVDTDDPPKALLPYTSSFTTFKPSVQGPGDGGFGSPGIGVVGNLAFVVQNNFYNGLVSIWDVEDPSIPLNLTESPLIVAPRPIDVSADPAGEVVAAVSVVSTNLSKPSSVVFVGGEDPKVPTLKGAVTVAGSAQEGFISRTAFHKGFVYLATTKKGVQIVDAARGQNVTDPITDFNARRAINTDGQGFGQDALVQTIPYPGLAGGGLVFMSDIAAADIQGQALVAATGALPLLLVDPQFGSVRSHWQPNAQTVAVGDPANPGQTIQAAIAAGYAIGLGRVGAYDLAVIAALVDEPAPASRIRLITVDVRDAGSPVVLGSVDLRPDGGPLDVTLRGTTAIVTTQKNNREGEAIIVELVDPRNPYIKGRSAGAGGRAAINQDGQIVTTADSPFGGAETPIGGIHSLVLESTCVGVGSLQSRRVVQYRIFDPVNGVSHTEDARIGVNLCQRSQVTVSVDGEPLNTRVDGLTTRVVSGIDLGEGTHSILVPRDLLSSETDEKTFTVTIKSVVDEEVRSIVGTVVGDVRNRPMLPISHTFVKGVDLFDGHLATGMTDLQVKGRHFTLEVSRSYSSAGLGEGNSGWRWNYEALISSSEGIYNVITADGSSQRFTAPDGGTTFVPQKGYHTRLARGGDGEMVFTDKAANVHRFLARSSDTWQSGPWLLDSVEEPHGDRLKVAYNKYGRVATVKEYWKGSDTAATTLTFVYEPFRAGVPGQPLDPADLALAKVTGEAASRTLNLTVKYEYNESGELRFVTRKGGNIASGPAAADQVWEYRYVPALGRDANRLERVIDPDGHGIRYVFIEQPYSPSEGDVSGREEFVHQVIEIPGGGVNDVVTEFSYGPRSNAATSSTTTVKDPRGNDTVYTMNVHGGVTNIAEPLGRNTVIEWMTTDALKSKETLPGGVVKDYQYDANGNMTRETTTGAGGTPVAINSSTYDLKFNRPLTQTDAENRTTIWTLNFATGDIETMTNAVGDLTSYVYDPATGLLQTETDPRGVVTTYDQNVALGMWKSRTSTMASTVPSQVTANRTIDARGRVTREVDGLGAETVRTFDGLDRPVQTRRVAYVTAGGGATPAQDTGGEATTVEYTPGGQPKKVTNSLGAVTTNTFDGLNRITETSTPVTGGVPTTITTGTEYDGNGNVTRTTDPRGVVRQFTYDALNRLTQVEILSGPSAGPLGTIASTTYVGATDFKETETDISGNTTTYAYDGLFRVSDRLAPEPGYVDHFDYDLVGNVIRQTDANGKITKTDYDRLNRVTKVTRDLGGPSEFYVETKYEEIPNAAHVFKTEEYDSQKKLRVKYANDVAGRVVARAQMLEGAGSVEARAGTAAHSAEPSVNSNALPFFGGQDTTAPVRYIWAYLHDVGVSGAARQTITEPSLGYQSESRSSRVYIDGLGRETLRSHGARVPMETKYDGLGNKTSFKDENGFITKWDYDTAGRLIKMTDAENKSATYEVDPAGNRTKEIDRRGVVKTFGYDNLNRLVSTSVAGSLSGVPWTETVDYLDSARQVRVTDARGTVTLTTNDRLGRPRTITQFGTQANGGNRTREITYDGADKKTESDWRGNVTTLEYDGLHRVTKSIDPAPFSNQTVETFYDDANNRIRVKDRRGNFTVTQTDSLGRVVWIHRGLCDENGTASATCEPVERNEYDGSGNKVLTADGREKKTRFQYDDANRLIAREDGFEAPLPADRVITRFKLDDGGRVMEEHRGRLAYPSEPAVTYGYDKVNRVTSEKNGALEETIYGYDEEGNRTSVKPPDQPARTYAYDELGKLVSVTLPATEDYATPAVTTYAYDENRNKTTQTDARGNTTTFDYDRANRLTRMLEPGNLETKYEYDENGNVTLMTDAKLQTETSGYDELNRKQQTTYALAPGATSEAWREVTQTTYAYDQNSNRTKVHQFVASGTDPPGGATMDRSIIQTFDALDRVKTETTTLPDGGTKEVAYDYFPNGTRRAVTLDGRRTEYEYDGQNRVKTMTTSDALVTAYTYYPDDLLKDTLAPNGVTASKTYDKADRLLTVTNAGPTGTLSSYVYTYDHNGNRLTQTEVNPAVPPTPPDVTPAQAGAQETTNYTYDAANRLKSVTYPVDGKYPNGRKVTYVYDKVGNREHETEITTAGDIMVDRAGVFDENNRLNSLTTTAAPPTDPPNVVLPPDVTPADPGSGSGAGAGAQATGTLLIAYDNNGNETVRIATTPLPPDAEGNPQPPLVVTTQSVYDVKDRLVEQERGADILTRHEYDADGRRTKKIGEEGIRQYVYDDTSILAEYSPDGVEIAKYDYGADRLIRLTRADEGTRYMTFDGLGSVTGLTNPGGDVTATYHLDAWGSYRFTSELAPSHNRFGFTGHYWDKEASLYYAKARYYDPFTARFTQADSFLGTIDDPPSLHRYYYANANPTRYVDLTGNESYAAACQGYSGGCADSGRVADEDKAFGGVVYAAGRGIAVTGQLTHDFIGTLMYGNGEQLHEESALRFFGMVDQVRRRGILGTIKDGFKRSFDDFNKGLDEGDAFAMGAATGDAATNAVMIAEGGAGVVRTVVKVAPRVIAATKSATQAVGRAMDAQAASAELNVAREVLAGRKSELGSTFQMSKNEATVVLARANRGRAPYSELNASIAEHHGWRTALEEGQIGIRPPTKASAGGVDFVTFDPVKREVVVWDAKYRGPGGRYPSTVPVKKVAAWTTQAKEAVDAMPDSPMKTEILDALNSGRVRPQIFRWPQ